MPVAAADRVFLDATFRGTYWDRTTGYFYFPNMGMLGGGGGLTFARRSADATVASSTFNLIDAINVDLTAPAAPADGDEIAISMPVAKAGCTFVPNSGQTVEGSGSAFALTVGGSAVRMTIHFRYDLANTNWYYTVLTS